MAGGDPAVLRRRYSADRAARRLAARLVTRRHHRAPHPARGVPHAVASAGQDVPGWSVPLQVDYRLLGSALARVRWELDVLQGWRRNPRFYVVPDPRRRVRSPARPDARRPPRAANTIQARLDRIPATLEAARANLDAPVRPFAQLAIDALDDIEARLAAGGRGADTRNRAGKNRARPLRRLAARSTRRHADRDRHRSRRRTSVSCARWRSIPARPNRSPPPASKSSTARSASKRFERNRNRGLPELPLPATLAEQIEREAAGEAHAAPVLRRARPAQLPRPGSAATATCPCPATSRRCAALGVTDDLTSRRGSRRRHRYIPEPSPDLPYFYLAMARDPRTLIAHEGVPLLPARRARGRTPTRSAATTTTPVPNEGIGFYAEEMLLQAGLFDDSPRSREIIYNFMRLRALRVSVDVRLATRRADHRHRRRRACPRVPMDVETARDEAAVVRLRARPGDHLSDRQARRSCASWPTRALSAAPSSACARSTTTCSSKATCRFRCSAGKRSACATRSKNLTRLASACQREPTFG